MCYISIVFSDYLQRKKKKIETVNYMKQRNVDNKKEKDNLPINIPLRIWIFNKRMYFLKSKKTGYCSA